MKIYYRLDSIKFSSPTAITIGVFDGVHLGHRFILSELRDLAEQNNLTPVVMTFSPHPQIYFSRDPEFRILSTDTEKINILNNLGIDNLILTPFESVVNYSYSDFIEIILHKKLNTKYLIFGYNQKIGKQGEGDFFKVSQFTTQFGIKVVQTPEMPNSPHISSSSIRKKILSGFLADANKMLGYHYSFEAIVVEGNKIGRNLGFPTANLKLVDSNKIMPKPGVYAVLVHYNNSTYQGMMNYGKRPTVTNSNDLVAEVNLFDFNHDLYHQSVRIDVVERIRDEVKFQSTHELLLQLNQDKINSIKILSQIF